MYSNSVKVWCGGGHLYRVDEREEDTYLGAIIPCRHAPITFYNFSLLIPPPHTQHHSLFLAEPCWLSARPVRGPTYLKGCVMDRVVSAGAQAKQLLSDL